MKKKFPLTIMILAFSLYYSQVGIGQNVTTFDDSEILKIVSNNKGLLIPNISIPNINLAAPVSNPADALLVYNTNTTSGVGFYVWKNNKWNALLTSSNAYKYLGIINSSTTVSNNRVLDTSQNGAEQYTVGELASDHDWQLIPNLSKTINLYSVNNNVSINVNGIVQVNNANNNINSTNSYAVAIFIDDKLAVARNYIINSEGLCTYNDFNIMNVAKNLTPGSHTIKVYETYRVNLNSTTVNATLSFGDKISTCNNLSSDMARTIMNIQISENP